MILTGKQIAEEVKADRIFISGFKPEKVNPNSYNLTLNNTLTVYSQSGILDIAKQNEITTIEIPKEGLVLEPGKLYLGCTNEWTETDYFVPMLEGRSSIGRLGIFIHVTAGFGDVGFKGTWTLEITCIEPVRIYPDVEICQIYYHTPLGEKTFYRSGKYSNQTNARSSQLWQEFQSKK